MEGVVGKMQRKCCSPFFEDDLIGFPTKRDIKDLTFIENNS